MEKKRPKPGLQQQQHLKSRAKKSTEAMGKKDVGGSNFQVGASTARRSCKKAGYRRAFGLYRFAWLFIGCCLVSVCEILGLSPVPNGDGSTGFPGTTSTATGLRKLVFDYLAGSGTAYDIVVSTYGHIQNWDTSQVTNMKYLFFNMQSGNPDISKWNTGAVTTMYGSKSFAIECCFFCSCQLMLFVGWLVCVLLLTAFFFFFFYSFIATRPSTFTVLCLYLCFYCAVFQSNSAFNSDISKWNTGALIFVEKSKSFTIKCCVFCLCQLILFVRLLVVVVDSILILFIYSIH
jgi:surface protein